MIGVLRNKTVHHRVLVFRGGPDIWSAHALPDALAVPIRKRLN